MRTGVLTTCLRMATAVVIIAALGSVNDGRVTAASGWSAKLDPLLQRRVPLTGRSRVIVRASTGGALAPVLTAVQALGGRLGRRLPLIEGAAIDVPNAAIPALASNPLVLHVSYDRATAGAMERTGATVGATGVRQEYGYDGSGIGVAIIDSGVTAWHDDLGTAAGTAQRVDRFVDFVNGATAAYDDYGHGTHVAGIVAGNGLDSGGARTGIAPAAHLVVLKVLDGAGRGRISDVIAALDYAVSHASELNIRVVNLSVATGVYESYNVDPLTVAAERAVSAGIVVVAAAGNNGRSAAGTTQYAGIAAPGNAPWVLTVGASSHMGTVDRSDDTMAAFSSRGPGSLDYGAKPDLVAPGVGIESLSDPDSWMYGAYPQALLSGTVVTPPLPYLSLSGTSMATPVVTGTVALMLQANPSLTPNLVKAILEYTAQVYPSYDPLTQGAGFLNAKGAVELARYLAAPETTEYPSADGWSGRIIWGNHMTRGGVLTAAATAWPASVTWGASATPDGRRVTWGIICSSLLCDRENQQTWSAWQTGCVDLLCQALDTATSAYPNVVWRAICGGADCSVPWTTTLVMGTDADGETVVWGTDAADADTVVWGTSDADGETVVWGTSCGDPSCRPFVWGRQ